MWTAGAAIADARPLYDIHWVTMAHDKRRHTDHGGATTHVATALGTDSTARDFLGVVRVYASRHWAWPVIGLLGWLLRSHRNSEPIQAVLIIGMCVVALAGWNQLATNSYWRWRWGILIAGTAFLASIYLLPVLLVLLVAVVIDLCFIAPHRGL